MIQRREKTKEREKTHTHTHKTNFQIASASKEIMIQQIEIHDASEDADTYEEKEKYIYNRSCRHEVRRHWLEQRRKKTHTEANPW